MLAAILGAHGLDRRCWSTLEIFGFGVWLPCMLAWWRLLSLSGRDACCPGSVGIEVFNVGGWLTNGDFAAETNADFLCVTEHRLVSARARSEWRRLRDRSIPSIWSLASQELSVVGNAGVGEVSLKGAPSALPTFATPGFLGCRRFMHLVVLYGYFVADSCAEKLQLTNQLFEAALGELAVVARVSLVLLLVIST